MSDAAGFSEWTLPVLLNHQGTKPIGKVTSRLESLEIEFLPGHALTEAQFFAVFGNVGCELLETVIGDDGVVFIQRARVREFSLPPEEPPVQRCRCFQDRRNPEVWHPSPLCPIHGANGR